MVGKQSERDIRARSPKRSRKYSKAKSPRVGSTDGSPPGGAGDGEGTDHILPSSILRCGRSAILRHSAALDHPRALRERVGGLARSADLLLRGALLLSIENARSRASAHHIGVGSKGFSERSCARLDGDARDDDKVVVQPVLREFLFDVTMTIYLDPSLGTAFRCPVFPVTLGRSQDLAEIVAVEPLELLKSPRARLEHTLLPRALRPCVRFGSTVLLSRHISKPPKREATFAQYIVLHEPVLLGGPPDTTRTFERVEGVGFG